MSIKKSGIITLCGPPQRGQIHPDQRPGGGEGGHCHQQAPDHPQPHLGHPEPRGVPVRLCGHPGPAQGPHPPGGLHGERGEGERGRRGRGAPAGGAHPQHRRPGGGAHRPDQDPGLSLGAGHQQGGHPGAQGEAAGGHPDLHPGPTTSPPWCPSPPKTARGWRSCWGCWRASCPRGPSCSPRT